MKLPIEGARALTMRRLDRRPNLLLQKYLSLASYCKFEKIPWNDVLPIFQIHHDVFDFLNVRFKRSKFAGSLKLEIHFRLCYKILTNTEHSTTHAHQIPHHIPFPAKFERKKATQIPAVSVWKRSGELMLTPVLNPAEH
jgi:hypothetical protein